MNLRIPASKKYPQELPHTLGEHAFLFTLFLIAFAAGISALVFFVAVFPKESRETEIQATAVELQKDVFEDILQEQSLQNQEVQDSKTSLPKNIFRLGG